MFLFTSFFWPFFFLFLVFLNTQVIESVEASPPLVALVEFLEPGLLQETKKGISAWFSTDNQAEQQVLALVEPMSQVTRFFNQGEFMFQG